MNKTKIYPHEAYIPEEKKGNKKVNKIISLLNFKYFSFYFSGKNYNFNSLLRQRDHLPHI